MPYKDKVIWIIGASSGIGHGLAVELHAQNAKLILSARNEGDLRSLNKSCGDKHLVAPVDVTDVQALESIATKAIDMHGRIDSMVFMAATYEPGPIGKIKLASIHHILDVNIKGAFNAVHAVLAHMRGRKSGQIVLCGSVAGYRGLPGGQPYCATKAAIISYAESLRVEEEGNGIDVKVINPGFVKTRLTDKNKFTMPMMIQVDEAARIIAKEMQRKRFEIHFPKRFTLLVKAFTAMPYWLFLRAARLLKY